MLRSFVRTFVALVVTALLCAPPGVRAIAATPVVTLGDDAFLDTGWKELKGRCVGIVTNRSGVTARGESVVDATRKNPQICIKALYAPEHGLRGDRDAGAYVPSYTDTATGLPVYSLYGATRHPSAAMLAGVDVLLFDIQDVGDRAYTYISTMAFVMQAAAQFDKEVWILDRPNPIGGELVEGPVLEPKFSSFIGLYPIAVRHGMTVGELARMENDAFHIGAHLRVIPMRGWKRAMLWGETGLTWIPTSPNIPTWETTLVYPATGLLAKAGINNAAGTQAPFRYAGAYGADGTKLAAWLNARAIPGVHFQPVTWQPPSGFWAGKTLGGVELAIDDPHTFPSVRTAVEFLVAARALKIGNVSQDAAGIDHDWGTDSLRTAIASGLDADATIARWDASLAAFRTLRAKYLLYP